MPRPSTSTSLVWRVAQLGVSLFTISTVAVGQAGNSGAVPRASVAAGSVGGSTSVSGRITDAEGRPLEGAIVTIATRLVQTNRDGVFTLQDVSPGAQVIRVRLLGYRLDSLVVSVPLEQPITIALQPVRTALSAVRVEEKRAAGSAISLSKQRIAPNLKVLSVAEEIQALPNANAADAVSRLSGVSLQRHEGEGAYVQLRGLDGDLANITINGGHIAGNFDDKGGGGKRVAKLDGIASELLAMAQVSKTLTPDMDADAIGGSVNIETKTANDAPGLRLIGSYGQSNLYNAPQRQGAVSYGRRYGDRKELGMFVGLSYDTNNRIYDDVEPNYGYKSFNGVSNIVPLTTSRREYFTQRDRRGAAISTDYHWDNATSLNVRGMFTRFNDAAIRYRQDQTIGKTTTAYTPTSATTGTATGGSVTSNVQQRTPIDQNYVLAITGTGEPGRVKLDYALNVTQNEFIRLNAADVTFTQKGLTMNVDRSDPIIPMIVPQGAYPSDPTKFAFTTDAIANQIARGRDYAGIVNGRIDLGTQTPSALQFGLKLRQERRTFDDASTTYALNAGKTFTLADVLGSFTNADHFWGHYPLGIAPSDRLNESFIKSHPEMFSVTPDSKLTSLLNVYAGTERIGAGYASYLVDAGRWHWLAGLRVENTGTTYTANKAVTDPVTKQTSVAAVAGSGNYTNAFPSAQLRYELNDNTNLRVAVSTGIARPLYYDLAPHASVTPGATAADPQAVTLGNTELKPMTSVNYDLMLEHFSSNVGVASIGTFYKQVKNLIYAQTFKYVGAPYDGFNAVQPRNGPSGTVYGVEGSFVQRMSFLPWGLDGLGLDANATYTQSTSDIPGRLGKPFPRQANWNGNAALTYAKGIVSSRVTLQYNGPYIYTLGDGSTSVQTGDTYMMEHKQIDASVNFQVFSNAQFVIQALNMNNAPFGYFFGGDHTAIKQRELYGRTITAIWRYTY